MFSAFIEITSLHILGIAVSAVIFVLGAAFLYVRTGLDRKKLLLTLGKSALLGGVIGYLVFATFLTMGWDGETLIQYALWNIGTGQVVFFIIGAIIGGALSFVERSNNPYVTRIYSVVFLGAFIGGILGFLFYTLTVFVVLL